MKSKLLVVALALFFLYSFRYDEAEKETEITWRADRPLVWKDFSGKIDAKSSYDAWTFSGISYVYSWHYIGSEIKADINAHAYFDPELSWIKKGKATDELLAHEQLHFDIAELHCRYFLQRTDLFTYTDQVDAEIDSLYNVTFEEMLACQIRYDEESDHYRNKEGQKKWTTFVHAELDRLNKYAH